MPYIRSARACDGPQGVSEGWFYYLGDDGQAKFHRSILHDAPGMGVEATVRLLQDYERMYPYAISRLADLVLDEAEELSHPSRIAAAAVVRICRLEHHADGSQTEPGKTRTEARVRAVWVPRGAGKVAVRSLVDFDQDGIGVAVPLMEDSTSTIRQVATLPLTIRERLDFGARASRPEVIRAAPAFGGFSMDIVVHPDGQGGTLERIFQVDDRVQPML